MNQHIIVLKRGDEIVSSILDFCSRTQIKSAWISGIGAVSEATLALYDLENKTYSKKSFNQPLEIASLSGNVALLHNKTVQHLHTVLSDAQMNAFGGHLDSAIVAATCEIIVQPLKTELRRQHNDHIGLNLIVK